MSLIVFEINNVHASFRLIGLSLGFSALHLNVDAVDERYIRHGLARIEADGTIDTRSLIVRENIGRDAIDPSKAEIDRIDSVLFDFLSVFDAALFSSFAFTACQPIYLLLRHVETFPYYIISAISLDVGFA